MPVDAVFSNATFHWIADHDLLFRRLRAALKPGGALVAQCGVEAERQFRRVIGYRDLGKLAVAVEREVGAAPPPSPVIEEVRETVTV